MMRVFFSVVKTGVAFATVIVITFSVLSLHSIVKGNAESEKSKTINQYHETALFLAGKKIDPDSPLSTFCQSKYYHFYAANIEKGWEKFQKPNQNKIEHWWSQHKPYKYTDTVFYPFSGPDIMNALSFFPDAKTYILFGLEHPGIIPDPHPMNRGEIIAGLKGIRKSLNTILHVNFFKTINMGDELGKDSFNGITGLLMLFLALNDNEIVTVRKIAIDKNSNVVDGVPSDIKLKWNNPKKSWVPGVEITFINKNGKRQKIQYYMLNVIDSALAGSSPNFIPYLKKEAPFTTTIKSASYLMHNDNKKFTKIRSTILELSEFIVQDDSGIPLRYFTEGSWQLTFHGFYDRPIGMFINRTQRDLRKAMKDKSTGMLPFSYGYDYKPGQSNLMTAKKFN